MKKEVLLIPAVVMALWAASAQAAARTYIDIKDSRIEFLGYELIVGGVYDGMYEYWYDIYRGGNTWSARIRLEQFDATLIANNGAAGPQKWDWNAGHPGQRVGGGTNWFDYTTYWDSGTSQWVDATNWGYDDFNYYTKGEAAGGSPDVPQDNKYHPGVQPYNDLTSYEPEPDVNDYGMYWNASGGSYRDVDYETLVGTIRIVHPNAPGIVRWNTYANYQLGTPDDVYGFIIGPGTSAPPPGDFDDDGDVDVDDINALCANMTGDGIMLPPGFEQYDLDNDGDADSADMDILIHDLVETTVGIGTEYGDFNLDGKVDTVDLTILGTYFGVGTSWAQGNANCDTTVDTVDLTILGTYFGFVASSPIPEPATMSLLVLGGLTALKRR